MALATQQEQADVAEDDERETGAPPGPEPRIADRYVLEEVIGKGGMGSVFRGHDERTGRTVAIKIPHPYLAQNEGVRSRFEREARATAGLRTPHIARVLDIGTLESNIPYFVMEHVRGTNLRSLVDRMGPLPVEDACDYMLQACSALAEAHALGIIHRDDKPTNIVLTQTHGGETLIKMLDFGVAKFESPNIAGPSSHQTLDVMLGSLHYMAPEQVSSPADVDARADIFSVGATLFFLLTGVAPSAGKTAGETFHHLSHGIRPTLASLRPDAPADLEGIFRRCLARKKHERFANMTDLGRHLVLFSIRTSEADTTLPSLRATVRIDEPKE